MLDKPVDVKRTEYGIRVDCPDYNMSVEVEDTIWDYLRARQYFYLIANHVLKGTFSDCDDHFSRVY